MIKRYLVFLPIHITFATFLLIGIFISSLDTIEIDLVNIWRDMIIIYFPIASIGNVQQLIISRRENNNLSSFSITLPIMFVPYLIVLFLY